jgi:transposase
MTHFVGLDVSQKLTAICIVDDTGRRLWRGQCAPDPEQIERVVRRHGGNEARIGIETGPMTPWLVHELRGRGLDVTCLDARHAQAALKTQINKTDQNNAEGLAQIMRTGWFRSVYVKSFGSHRTRSAHARGLATVAPADRRLRQSGTRAGEVEPPVPSPDGRTRDRRVVCPRLCQHGRGSRTFRQVRSVGAHLGLTPKQYQSGEIDRSGRISKCGDTLTRTLMCEAAVVLMTRVKRASGLKEWAQATARRSGAGKARVALARKLSVVLHSMWRSGEPFRWSEQPTAV